MSGMFCDETPIDRYRVGSRTVRVKRDDLYARPPAPPLAKLRGAMALLADLYSQGVRLVGCWDTRISALGQGIAACCQAFPGMRVIVAYPKAKDSGTPPSIARAKDLGSEILPVIAGRITISFAAARHEVEKRGGVMLPFGLECSQSVTFVAQAAAAVPTAYTEGGTVVVSTGSGVTLAGLVRGLPGRPHRFIGVSSGRSPISIQHCLRRYGVNTSRSVQVIAACEPYHVAAKFKCPFPSHPNYDLKAWRYLVENADSLKQPLFFWNVGA